MVNVFIHFLSGYSYDVLWLISVPLIYGTVLLFSYVFGYYGLITLNATFIILANIQVQKLVQFHHVFFLTHKVAMGTLVFSATYLISDIITEYFGRKAARRSVYIGFAVFLTWTVWIIISIGYPAVSTGNNLAVQQALTLIFTPMPRFFISGMISYLVSEMTDIFIFSAIRRVTGVGFLWFRNIVSTILSALLDSVVFSVFAWIILSPNPLPISEVFFTYVLGTFIMRSVLALLDTPAMYISKYTLKRHVFI